jgi:predicted SprT family Zn-dependent metalloprotease
MTNHLTPTPTAQQFTAFERAYDYFNQTLFDNQLPAVILNLSRKSKAMGFIAPFRWRTAGSEPTGQGTVHELSINPEILCMSLIDVYSTLVHEQCHIWQYAYGTPSRSGYHNKEWADKMESVGLIPSSTGFPGGNKTGQAMSDYPEENGVFMAALEAMPESFKLPFVSTEGDMLAVMLAQGNGSPSTGAGGRPEGGYVPLSAGGRKNKTKYCCSCGINVWGKPELQIICGECGGTFQETQ